MPISRFNSYKFSILTLGILAVLAILGFWAFGEMQDQKTKPQIQNNGSLTPQKDPKGTNSGQSGSNQPGADSGPNSPSTGNVVNVAISGKPFEFSTKEIRVKQGDRVRVVFTNNEGMHDWVIDEFNARTPRIQAGQSATVEFTANRKGTFEYYCSVGTHRQMGMVGKLIIE